MAYHHNIVGSEAATRSRYAPGFGAMRMSAPRPHRRLAHVLALLGAVALVGGLVVGSVMDARASAQHWGVGASGFENVRLLAKGQPAPIRLET